MSQYFDNKDLFVGPKTTQYGNHMIMTNVVKETRKKYINIDSRFHDEYMSGNIYTVTLPERINDVKSLVVCNAEIPMSIYNVSGDLGNNYFKITCDNDEGSSVAMILINDGQYTAESLKNFINNYFSNLGYPFNKLSCSVSGNLFSFQYNVANEYDPELNFTIDFAVDATGAFDKYNFKGKAGWLMGFRTLTTQVGYSYSRLITGTAFVNMQSLRYLYLVVDEFTRGNSNSFVSPLATSFINKNILARIVLDSANYPYGSVLTANVFNGHLLSDCRAYSGKVDLQKLAIQLVNEYGVPVNLNGLDFSFCLEVQYE